MASPSSPACSTTQTTTNLSASQIAAPYWTELINISYATPPSTNHPSFSVPRLPTLTTTAILRVAIIATVQSSINYHYP